MTKCIKILFLTILSISLFAEEPISQDKETSKNILEYEKILAKMQEKKDVQAEIEKEKEKIQKMNEIKKEPIDFSVIGVFKTKKIEYAYLMSKENKVLKVNKGINFNGYTIIEIDNYGVKVNNGSETTFLPIVSNQIQEIDVVFNGDNGSRPNRK